MPSRLTRPLLIALFACLHLVLQPMAASAPCTWLGNGGADCCCAPADETGGEATSCCASEVEAAESEPASEPCKCAVAPELPPATTPELVELLKDPFGLDVALSAPVWTDASMASSRDLVARVVRSPGDGPPRHLRLQVFRL